MQKPLAGAALVAALASLIVTAFLARAHTRRDREQADRLAAELDLLRAGLERDRAPAVSTAELLELAARVDRLEQADARQPVAAAPIPASAPTPGTAGPKGIPEAPGTDGDAHAELEELIARLVGPDFDLHGSDQELERFFELARETDVLGELLDALEAGVEERPGDLEARMRLADAYVAKLMTVPNGPEQGLWGSKAEEQWREVCTRDNEHWRAHLALGTNYSFYPDVLGKTGEAIRYLEQARSIQERQPPADEQVRTYLSLARMYLRDGRRPEARATLEAGLRLHPGSAELQAELERLGTD